MDTGRGTPLNLTYYMDSVNLLSCRDVIHPVMVKNVSEAFLPYPQIRHDYGTSYQFPFFLSIIIIIIDSAACCSYPFIFVLQCEI